MDIAKAIALALPRRLPPAFFARALNKFQPSELLSGHPLRPRFGARTARQTREATDEHRRHTAIGPPERQPRQRVYISLRRRRLFCGLGDADLYPLFRR